MKPTMAMKHPAGFGLILLVLIIFAYSFYTLQSAVLPTRFIYDSSHVRKALVVASVRGDNTTWLSENFAGWEQNVYVMDSSWARLKVAKNKGRESTAYLTYIIDNYDHLPDYTVFLHALRYQWHNDDPMYDGYQMIRRLRLSHVDDVGYASLRCSWTIGCPYEMKNLDGSLGEQMETESFFLQAFRELYPDLPEPNEIGAACCAQFAVSKAQVLKRPREDYRRYRQWLWDTNLTDQVAGRVLEYSWHTMMGKPAVHCPSASDCYCKTYGLCDLDCQDEGSCGRYTLPPSATMPQHWPNSGEEGKDGWPAKDWRL